MLVVLKIPVVYLCIVVWWAIRAEPRPPEGALQPARLLSTPPECDWRARRSRLLRRGPLPAWRPAASEARPRRARPRAGDGVSVDAGTGERERWTAADTVAGLLATVSIFASALGTIWRPLRILPFAIVLALVAARMSARQQRLAGFAVAAAVICWTVGLTIAVVTENPLW